MKEKQQDFQDEIAKNAEQFSEMLGSIGTTKKGTERDSAVARIMEEWE